MVDFRLELLIFRLLFSIIGIIGNLVLMVSIIQNKVNRLKSFEVFLLGLAVSNLEEIFIVDTYDIIVLRSTYTSGIESCETLKFLTVFGEVASILFTVVISIFRYQKLRDAETRVNLPIFMDNIRAAWAISGLCVILAVVLSAPTYFMNFDEHKDNFTQNNSCPPDFFQCPKDNCRLKNYIYKYIFIFFCNLLPLFIVTVTSCLIIKVLKGQKRVVVPALSALGQPPGRKSKKPIFQKSTVAILAAMAVFQIDWTLYLVLHLAFTPDDFPAWTEVEFFITTSYTTICPYVYGIGNNFFSLKHFKK